MNVIETSGLGKRYGSNWALRECSLTIPAGHVAALVGPNGAGKTTLLNLAAGLAKPTAGEVTVLGGLAPGSPCALDGIAFVAQDMPLYKNLSAEHLLHLTRSLNRMFTMVAGRRPPGRGSSSASTATRPARRRSPSGPTIAATPSSRAMDFGRTTKATSILPRMAPCRA